MTTEQWTTHIADTRQALFWVSGPIHCDRPRASIRYRNDRTAWIQIYTPPPVRVWREEVAYEYRAAALRKGLPVDGEHVGKVEAYVRCLGFHGDPDNALKTVLDALQGIAFRNDAQVIDQRSRVDDRVLTEKGMPRRPKDVASGVWVTLTFLELT